jgi:hypothetical protein
MSKRAEAEAAAFDARQLPPEIARLLHLTPPLN